MLVLLNFLEDQFSILKINIDLKIKMLAKLE